MTEPDVQSADPGVPAADPDGFAEISQAAAPEVAPTGVLPAVAATSARSAEELPAEELPADDLPAAAVPGQPPLSDSLQAQVAGLEALDGLPVAEHIERYEALHNELHAALRGIHDPGG